jgi:hypothetical protein
MRRVERFAAILTALVLVLSPMPVSAWNYTGHRVIASIAYHQLDDKTKRKIAEVLMQHPAYADLWVAPGPGTAGDAPS